MRRDQSADKKQKKEKPLLRRKRKMIYMWYNHNLISITVSSLHQIMINGVCNSCCVLWPSKPSLGTQTPVIVRVHIVSFLVEQFSSFKAKCLVTEIWRSSIAEIRKSSWNSIVWKAPVTALWKPSITDIWMSPVFDWRREERTVKSAMRSVHFSVSMVGFFCPRWTKRCPWKIFFMQVIMVCF